MGKLKKRGGSGGKNQQNKGGGGRGSKGRQKDDSPVVAKRKVAGNSFPIPGLVNLGNTCFFNSVMQSIGQTDHLRQRLRELTASPQYCLQLTDHEEHQLQVEVTEMPGQLTKTLDTFLGEMNTHTGRTLNPRPLFSQICDKAPRFRGFQQQDSQELLRYMLDSLKMEEVHRIKRAILVAFNVTSTKKSKREEGLTEKDRRLIKLFGSIADRCQTLVDEVFGGSLVSTITCNECHNCSTLEENYLDLSLSIPRDKMSFPSPTSGRQPKNSRDKRETHTRECGSRAEKGGGGKEKERESSEPVAMSKYQTKKARKKMRKEGKSVKRQLHELEEMISKRDDDEKTHTTNDKSDEKNTSVGETVVEEGGELEGREEEGEGEKETSQTDCVDTCAEGDGCVGEGERGECANGGCEMGRGGCGEGGEGAGVDGVAGDEKKAAHETESLGPSVNEHHNSNDVNETTPTTTPTTHLANESTAVEAEVTKPSSDDCNTAQLEPHDENIVNTQPEQEPASGPDSQDSCGEESADAASPGQPREATPTPSETCSPLTSVVCSEDSIEGCLKRFCTPEVLTDANQFFCAMCTRRSSEQKAAAKRARGSSCENESKERLSSETHDVIEDSGVSEERTGRGTANGRAVEKLENGSSNSDSHEVVGNGEVSEDRAKLDGDRGAEKVEDGSENGETSVEAETHMNSDEEAIINGDTITGDMSQNVEEEAEEEKKEKEEEEKEELVFRDATKQLLIKSVPPVLTLHLKRFLQEGRKLRKNGRHIKFPNVLDMAPYCVADCKSLCDDGGHMLYSLYAAVEHTGGMHNGHYTAYVRARNNENHTPLTTVGGASNTANHDNHSLSENGENVRSECSSESEAASNCTENGTTQRQRETTMTTDDHLLDQTVPPVDVTNGDTTRDQMVSENGTTDDKPPTCSTTLPQTRPKTGENLPNRTKPTFDLSSMAGQWYHISDTHVRTATATEVHKTHAYILFYERLPLKIS